MDDKERITRGKSIKAQAENAVREAERAAKRLEELRANCEHRLADAGFYRHADQRAAPAGKIIGETRWECVYCDYAILVETAKDRAAPAPAPGKTPGGKK